MDLERRWLCAGDKRELCHRICQTAVLLLNTPAVALGMTQADGSYAIMASEGDWSDAPGGSPSSARHLLRKARETGLAQLKSAGDNSTGIFPFRVDDELAGCLHVKIARPIFQGAEVSFLRFLASLTGIVLAGGPALKAEPTREAEEQPALRQPEHARRYVAMAVHDLRNPIHVVAGYAEMLADGSLGELQPAQTAAVAAINRQVEVLLSTVDQLIDLDRLTGTEPPVEHLSFGLRELFEELAATRFAHASDRIDWPGPEAAFEFTTDRKRLISIVQNLVDNALKYGGDAPIKVDCTRRDKQLIVEVVDRGPGLAAPLRAALIAGSPDDLLAAQSGLGLYALACHLRTLAATIAFHESDRGGTHVEVRIPPARSNTVAETV